MRRRVETMAPVPRSVICACGWGDVFPNPRAADAAVGYHIETGCEGCDHTINMEDATS